MWPWGHLAVAYLCYSAILHVRDDEQTAGRLLAVAVGSQVPDLVDKPLAWSLGVLPSGRTLAHSLLVATVAITILYRVGRHFHREDLLGALSVGWISHSLSDLGPAVMIGLVGGDSTQLKWTTYLFWPLLPAPAYPHDESFGEHFDAFVFDPYVGAQTALFIVAIGVWFASGKPGLDATCRWVRDKITSARQY